MTVRNAVSIAFTTLTLFATPFAAGCGGMDHDHDSSLALAAPSDLQGMVMNGGVHLSWKDNSCDEDGFMIMRRTEGAEFTDVGRAGADATYFHDRTVSAGATYTYVVHALHSTRSSPSSNELTIAVR